MNIFIAIASLVLLIFVTLILETTVINFPFTFFIGAILLYMLKKNPVYIGVMILGIIIDALRVTNFGLTPIFLFSTVILMLFYEKFSGSSDAVIAGFIIALTGFFYSQFLGYSLGLTISFMAICTVIWVTYRILKRRGTIS